MLNELPVGAALPDTMPRQFFLSALEFLLPTLLAEEHPWWRWEELDGILPEIARKTGPWSAEILGLCILISDQTLTPLHVRLGIHPEVDEVVWLECEIGESGPGNGGLRRIPYKRRDKELFQVGRRADEIEWVYRTHVGDVHDLS